MLKSPHLAAKAETMKIGIMTGGGDAPGLNGIIEAVGRTLLGRGHEVIGIQNGFEGIFKRDVRVICEKTLQGLHAQAGTLLGASNRSKIEGREAEFVAAYRSLALDGLIVAGGDGTFRGISRVGNEVQVVGVPKTIDNDLPGTDSTFGFDTACTVVADALDALWHTAEAHERIFFVEAMGRTAGWIALGGGLASYADAILIPERPFSHEALLTFLCEKHKRQKAMLVVVAEGAKPQGGESVTLTQAKQGRDIRFGGMAAQLAHWMESETNFEARHVVLGHLQRSHTPTTADRLMTLEMGVVAARLAMAEQWRRAVVYREGQVTDTRLEDIMGEPRVIPADHAWIQQAQSLNIFI